MVERAYHCCKRVLTDDCDTYLGESWDPATGGSNPFSLSWNSTTVPNGSYTLVAVAEYSGGLSNATSVGIAVRNT